MPTTYAIPNGRTVMDATTYTGNGSTQTITNAAGFKPDLFWGKARSLAYSNNLTDSVRGVGYELITDSTGAQQNNGGLTSFNSNGVTMSSWGGYNQNGATYVGWQWQAGQGTTSSNTSGSITSTVSVNATAGFSIVSYTGTGSAGTVGHGLGVAPSMIILKTRTNGTIGWGVYHASIGNTGYLLLNGTGATTTTANAWNNTTPTSSVFSIGIGSVTNNPSDNYVAYCWAQVAGFSQFGSYTGNGSADGSFVYTGFQPKMILIKRTDTTGNWIMWDTARNTYNVMGEELYPNLSNAGSTATDMDVLSNGFKLRNTTADFNANGGTYIYACWASNPFKYANAR